MDNPPVQATNSFNLFTIIQKSWERFWTYSNQIIAVSALVTIITMTLTYLNGGLDQVKANLGLIDPFNNPEQFTSTLRVSFTSLVILLNGIFTTLGSGVIISILHNSSRNIANEIRAVLPKTLPLLIAGFLGTLAVLGGIILFIIPGIVLGIWFMFAPTVVVVENKSAIDALKRGNGLVKGKFWSVLLITLLGFILLAALSATISTIPVFGPLASDILLWPFTVVFIYSLYTELIHFHARENNTQ
ncbi:MAG: hypothetical protein H6760_00835 [Candidatus Nomurabacteria bacterium]|nr:MAG: hypothetical protein H6760_00835 [Candidatus Nomurabacteria bacterium]